MVLRSIGVLSFAKILGVVYAVMGLIAGILMGLFTILGTLFEAGKAGDPGPIVGIMMAIGMVIFLPVFYGVIGYIGGALAAAIYNLAANYMGGLEMEFEPAATLQRGA